MKPVKEIAREIQYAFDLSGHNPEALYRVIAAALHAERERAEWAEEALHKRAVACREAVERAQKAEAERERLWCKACGTVSRDDTCDCTRMGTGTRRAENYADALLAEWKASGEALTKAEAEGDALRGYVHKEIDRCKTAESALATARNRALEEAAEAIRADIAEGREVWTRPTLADEAYLNGKEYCLETILALRTKEPE